MVDVLGYTPDQVVGTKGLLFVHEDDLEEVTAFVTRVVSSPDVVERLTLRVAIARGEWIWIEETLTNCVSVPDVRGLLGNIRDVTSEIKARMALTASERRYRTVVDTAQEGVVVLGQDATILFVNRAAAEMLGHSQSTLHRRRMTDVVDAASVEERRHAPAPRRS